MSILPTALYVVQKISNYYPFRSLKITGSDNDYKLGMVLEFWTESPKWTSRLDYGRNQVFYQMV